MEEGGIITTGDEGKIFPCPLVPLSPCPPCPPVPLSPCPPIPTSCVGTIELLLAGVWENCWTTIVSGDAMSCENPFCVYALIGAGVFS